MSSDKAPSAVNEYSFHQKIPVARNLVTVSGYCPQYTGAVELVSFSAVIHGTSDIHGESISVIVVPIDPCYANAGLFLARPALPERYFKNNDNRSA
jgi:hypothetical protein